MVDFAIAPGGKLKLFLKRGIKLRLRAKSTAQRNIENGMVSQTQQSGRLCQAQSGQISAYAATILPSKTHPSSRVGGLKLNGKISHGAPILEIRLLNELQRSPGKALLFFIRCCS